MATPFYKLKEGNKFYRIDIKRDENKNMIDYVYRTLEMARDASIENYKVRFICYDRTLNKNTMFICDVSHKDIMHTEYIDNDEDVKLEKTYITTSKKLADNYCEQLDKILGIEHE